MPVGHKKTCAACTSQGDLRLRDMRPWHRGMPNDSDAPRLMLLNSHHTFWRDRSGKVKIPSSARLSSMNCQLKPYTKSSRATGII
jgi:hypothetical protein